VSLDADAMREVARLLSTARNVSVLSGAGISVESGLPTFRGAEGLWRNVRAEDLATPEAFERDPSLVWDWYRMRRERMGAVAPNPAHLTLARLEPRFEAFSVVTQNIDGLHQKAGSRRVIELHGNIWRVRCFTHPAHRFSEAETRALEAGAQAEKVPHCPCGGAMRPDVVWFGEPLDPETLEAAIYAVRAATVLLVVGTSAVVYPAAALPGTAREAGAVVVEINPQETPLSGEAHIVLRGPAGAVLPELERLMDGRAT
jgi:NAD-dependent deacetylase